MNTNRHVAHPTPPTELPSGIAPPPPPGPENITKFIIDKEPERIKYIVPLHDVHCKYCGCYMRNVAGDIRCTPMKYIYSCPNCGEGFVSETYYPALDIKKIDENREDTFHVDLSCMSY